jgi:hypothetical protein
MPCSRLVKKKIYVNKNNMRLASNKVIFTDDDENSGIVAFKNNRMQITKPLNCLKGIASQNIAVGANARMVVSGKIEEAEATSFELATASPGASLNLGVAENLTSYTLKFPPNQGAQDEYLQLGNSGALQWTPVSEGQNVSAQEGAWNFGTVVQRWSNTGDPFTTATYAKIPFTRTWLTSSPSFEDYSNGKVVRLVNYAMIHWDQQTASSDWDFRTSIYFDNTPSSSMGLFIFGNNTENPSGQLSNTVGLRPADNRGILIELVSGNFIRFYEKGVLKKSVRLCFPIWTSDSRTLRLTRRDNQIRFEIFSAASVLSNSTQTMDAHVVASFTLTESYTGTRWGVGSVGYNSAVTYAEVRTN